MAENYQQRASGTMAYPKKGTLNRILFKSPLILWRMGLGSLMSHPAMARNKMLVLTTWGRKTHLPRHTMLSFVSVGDGVYICSGWGPKSDWYKNIRTNPVVTVQVGRRVYAAKARRVRDKDQFSKIVREMFETGGDSHFAPWLESFDIKYDLQDMIDKRDRLHILALDPSKEPGPPALTEDLRWIWGAIILFVVGIWLFMKRDNRKI